MKRLARSGSVIFLALTFLAASCATAKSAEYKRGYAGGRSCADLGVGYGVCLTLCQAAAEADGLDARQTDDYVSGCGDGYSGS